MTFETITIDPDIRSGEPVIKGTRFPVSQLLTELATSEYTLADLARNFNLDQSALTAVLLELANWLNDEINGFTKHPTLSQN
jgi:uncharacterized protein (DUF433 family)